MQAVFDEDGETLSVARRITRAGRSRAFLDGLVSSLPAVEAVLRDRVAFYGQLEHARLLQLDRQLDLLDAWAGPDLAALLAEYGAAWSRPADTLSRELAALRGEGRDREREIDLLRFQVDEIEAAAVEPGEDERLKAERERLRHAEKLVERVGGAAALLSDEASGGGLDALRAAARLLGRGRGGRPRPRRRRRRGSPASPPRPTTCSTCCAPTSTTSTSTRPTATPSSCATTSSRCSPASTAARPTR